MRWPAGTSCACNDAAFNGIDSVLPPIVVRMRPKHQRRGKMGVFNLTREAASSPRPACGERSPGEAHRSRAGEGDSPRVELVERAPHPNPLPAKSGGGGKEPAPPE